jgi:hypothetical protein
LKLFEAIPSNFFSILSSKNKEIYADCVFIIYKVVSLNTSFGVEREIVVQTMIDYFEGLEDKDIFSEEDSTIKSSREEANFILRRLEECGWIDIETTSNYIKILNLRDYAITILETFDRIMHNEGLEYQGYVYTIYSILFTKENTAYNIMLEQVYENTTKLVNGLKSLNSNIKKYIDVITTKKTPEEIMKLHFEGYTQDVIDKGYHRLKTSDNVSKFRPRIIEKLEDIRKNNDFIKLVCKQNVEMEKAADFDEAYERVISSLNDTINAFYNIDSIIDEIDRKNFQYIRASLTRVKYLLNTSRDLSGQVNEIFKFIVSMVEDNNLDIKEDSLNELSDLFNFFPQNFVDGKSLYTSTEGKQAFVPQSIDKTNISKDEREKRIKEIKEKNMSRMSRENIDKYVMGFVADRKTANGSMLPLNEINDYIKLIYIIVYSKSRLVHYRIKKLNREVIINGFSFNDFEIWRK